MSLQPDRSPENQSMLLATVGSPPRYLQTSPRPVAKSLSRSGQQRGPWTRTKRDLSASRQSPVHSPAPARCPIRPGGQQQVICRPAHSAPAGRRTTGPAHRWQDLSSYPYLLLYPRAGGYPDATDPLRGLSVPSPPRRQNRRRSRARRIAGPGIVPKLPKDCWAIATSCLSRCCRSRRMRTC